ncbi:MAG: TIGR02996 domain-containing protein [Kofleriaceae bacterium]
MQRRNFLDAIWAERDADEPRRVYADWLQQQGDARGEFIALQLEVAHGEASSAAVRRIKALLQEHRKAWLGAELAGELLNQKFERGFLGEREGQARRGVRGSTNVDE